MILHALFGNGISSVYELEYYIKNDIVKNSLTLNSIESQLSVRLLICGIHINNDNESVGDQKRRSGKRRCPLRWRWRRVDRASHSMPLYPQQSHTPTQWFFMGGLHRRRCHGPEGQRNRSGVWFSQPHRSTPVVETKEGCCCKAKVGPGVFFLKNILTLAISVDETEAVRYPPPPPFVPLQTKSIDKHIGLLRHYYQDRITKLAVPAKMPTPPPPPPPPIQEPAPPTPITKEPTPTPPPTVPAPAVPAFVFDPYNPSALAIGGSSVPTAAWSPPPSAAPPLPAPVAEEAPQPVVPAVPMGPPPAPVPIAAVPQPVATPLELPPTLEDDLPDPARVKVGPLGQIQQISASAALKQKRAAAKLAATGGSAAAIAAGLGSVSSLPKPAAKPKPKKPKEAKESKTTPKKASKKAAAAPPTPVAPTT